MSGASSGGQSGRRSGRERSHQRCYRRAWIERRTGLSYEGVRAIVRRAGFTLRQMSDGDIERMVRAKREERREKRSRAQRVARAVGRSVRWVSEAARRLGVELSEDAIGRLGEERDRVERVRRERIGRHRFSDIPNDNHAALNDRQRRTLTAHYSNHITLSGYDMATGLNSPQSHPPSEFDKSSNHTNDSVQITNTCAQRTVWYKHVVCAHGRWKHGQRGIGYR